MITDFDDKTLIEHCGWKTWKEGKEQSQVFEQLKVAPEVVSGLLKNGRKKIRAVVKLDGEAFIPSCTCDEFYKSHQFCSCCVALLLQARESKKDSKVVKNDDQINLNIKVLVELQQSLSKIIHNKKASLKVEITESETGNGKELSPFLGALKIPTDSGEYLVQLPLGSLIDLLRMNAKTSFIKGLMGSVSAARFPLKGKLSNGELSLVSEVVNKWQKFRIGNELLIYDEGASVYFLQPVPEELPVIDDILEGREISMSLAEYFTSIPNLSQWFDLATIDVDLQRRLSPQQPEFSINLEGTIKKLLATITVRYGEQELQLTGSNQFRFLSCENESIHITNTHAENEAFAYLLQAGFEATSDEYVLSGEMEILEFLAYTYPILVEREWEVRVMGSFRALAHNVVTLSPRLQIDPFDSNDDFASLQYSFESPEGQGMKSADATRLVQSGKQSFKLKNGKVALLSTREFALISEALKDCESRQSSGKYLIPVSEVPYYINLGIKMKGEVPVNNPRSHYEESNLIHINRNLRSYQKEGVSWLITCLQLHGGALLADDMGLGKTVQSIAVIETLAKSQKTLIVCPASLISNWESEIRKWSESDPHITIRSYQKYQREASKHYEQDYALCIIDEASMIKNPEAKISQALSQQPAQYKLALTGTPVENTAGDLWSIFRFLIPTYLGKQKRFNERFVQPLKTAGLTADLTSKRLRARLKSVVLRRTKQGVLTELPPKTYRTDVVSATAEQLEEFVRIKTEYQELAESDNANQIRILTSILRLRQVSNDPGLLSNNFTQYSPKTNRLIQILEQAKALNKKVLVFSQFASMLEALKSQLTEKGYNCSLLTGSTKNRDSEIQNFRDTNNVFLISLKAGGFGLNLTEASIVVHYDPWWNPAVENQATDRAYSMGQSEPVSVIKLITENSIDEQILKLQQQKQNLYSTTIEDQIQNAGDISTADLQQLIL